MGNVKVVKKETQEAKNENQLLISRPTDRVYECFVNQRVVIQMKNGMIIKGDFAGIYKGLLHLKRAEIISRRKKATPLNVFVERNFIAHIHEECTMEEIEKR